MVAEINPWNEEAMKNVPPRPLYLSQQAHHVTLSPKTTRTDDTLDSIMYMKKTSAGRKLAILLLALLSATFGLAYAHRHAEFHGLARKDWARRLALIHDEHAHQARQYGDDVTSEAFAIHTTTTGQQTLSTTVTYSYWSYTPIPTTNPSTIDSSQITTSTVITVIASDQFHGFQDLLTAGQSLGDAASSSAAQVLQMLQTPESVSATSTDNVTSSASSLPTISDAGISTTSSLIASATSATTSSEPSSTSAIPSTQTQQGVARTSTAAGPQVGIIFAIAAAFLMA